MLFCISCFGGIFNTGFLRLLLAIAVVLVHSSGIFGIGLLGGVEAVEIFFMISGFYMVLVLENIYIGTNGSFIL